MRRVKFGRRKAGNYDIIMIMAVKADRMAN